MPPIKNEVKLDLEDTKAIIRHILETLTKRCEEEAENDCCAIPFSNKQGRLKYYTGLSNAEVEKLINDTPEGTKLDLASRILILNTIKGFCVQHRLPTFNSIFEETHSKLKNIYDEPVENYSEFVKEMTILGYVWKETVNNSVIVMEDPEVRFERFMYLHKLKKFRSDSVQWPQIVYVDERLVNLSQKFEKPPRAGSSLKLSYNMDKSVFYHAVSKTGFITGMFSNQDDFNKWVMDVLTVQLKTPSVIIMDTLHGPPESVCPVTRYHSKTDMLLWLTNNNIPCSSNMSKPALFELIAKCNENQKEYLTDRILRSQGHEVLRLPRHLFDLSITTPLWKNFEKNIDMDIANTLMDLQNALMKKITSMPTAKWAEYDQDIQKTEREIFNIDTTMENFCDMYEIKM